MRVCLVISRLRNVGFHCASRRDRRKCDLLRFFKCWPVEKGRYSRPIRYGMTLAILTIDSTLNDIGIMQCRLLGKELEETPFTHVFCSPLRRAVHVFLFAILLTSRHVRWLCGVTFFRCLLAFATMIFKNTIVVSLRVFLRKNSKISLENSACRSKHLDPTSGKRYKFIDSITNS